ncbi:putative lipopolysaccharide-modifying enzyme [Lyophyllum shimeji]|uniref:Lipopolysaccharide-modifying enzyme n=1 Tax=Lyophyllum shimeji TaxID=47721 RepID=A0A9P3UMX7_LYOSH|nr:putative lipopolysaccharide-modifying enzyme [Lyophyllum shimeji]
MLLGRLSARGRRLLVVSLFALVFSLFFYCREPLIYTAKSSEPVLLPTPPSTPPKTDTKSLPECKPPVPKKEKLLSHTYRDDGILEVNPAGGHPIYELIDLANTRWKFKLSKASKTLDEAVREYVKRYNRRPPEGFDKWWRYVEKHNVQLPDEYDQIWRDLEPFWGFSPRDLQRIQKEQELHTDTFTLGKNETGDSVEVLKVSFARSTNDWKPEDLLGGAESIKQILKDVQHELPPFRAVISPHDNPTLFTDYEIKKTLLDAVDRGAYVAVDKLARGPGLGWLSGCSPSSPARQGKTTKPPPPTKTFIFDHRKAMEPCLHPYLFDSIGEFLVHDRPGTSDMMLSRFAYCATAMHHDIQIPTLSGWVDDTDDPEWESKLDERLNWRGSNTGMWHAPTTRWKEAQRARLVDFANGLNGTIRVLIPPSEKEKRIGEGVEISRAKINPAMMDVAFAGEPVGCHEETCPELLNRYEWRKRQGSKESGNFKYIIDVDGNAWSSRFKRLITTNSLIFKATVYPEWFQDRIEPWVHYVPVQVDYSDVYDALTFFRGGLYGEGAHQDLARKIASEGRAWSKDFWRKEDVTAYVYRLVLEYARVMSSDRDAMSYDG